MEGRRRRLSPRILDLCSSRDLLRGISQKRANFRRHGLQWGYVFVGFKSVEVVEEEGHVLQSMRSGFICRQDGVFL
jgi:hypothetical protein